MNKICPICKNNLDYYTPRYPNMICGNCSETNDVKDIDGNSVSYENESVMGGFISLHNINGKIIKRQDHNCWIGGIKCYADESRFGGIVIQV